MDDVLRNLINELRRGTHVIAALANLKTPQYGYSLLKKLESKNIIIEASTLYPLLRRLETQGLLTYVWDTSETRPRKYYQISDVGNHILNELIKTWKIINKEMVDIFNEGGYL